MLVRYHVSNYKRINDDIFLDFDKNYPFSAIFGQNQSGKTHLLESILTATEIFKSDMRSAVKKIPQHPSGDQVSDIATFTFWLKHEKHMYRYRFEVSFDRLEIQSESLSIMHEDDSEKMLIYQRNQHEVVLGKTFESHLDKLESQRLHTYIYDLSFDRKRLFASNVGILNFDETFHLKVFHVISDMFAHMHYYTQERDIYFFEDIKQKNYRWVLKTLNELGISIDRMSYETIDLDRLRNQLNRHRYDYFMDLYRQKMIDCQDPHTFVIAFDYFYRMSGDGLDQINIDTLQIQFKDGKKLYYDQMSKGFKQLLNILIAVATNQSGNFFIIDDLTNHLHPMMSRRLIEILRLHLKEQKSHLLFTTHELYLFDQELLHLKELYIIDEQEKTLLKHLKHYRIRRDKKIVNLYLQDYFAS